MPELCYQSTGFASNMNVKDATSASQRTDFLHVEGHQHRKTLHISRATFSQIARNVEFLIVPYVANTLCVIELDDHHRLLEIPALMISRPAERVSKLTALSTICSHIR